MVNIHNVLQTRVNTKVIFQSEADFEYDSSDKDPDYIPDSEDETEDNINISNIPERFDFIL